MERRYDSSRAQHRLESAVAGVRGVVRFNAPLKEYTSFHIGGPADVLVEPVDVEDVARLAKQTREQKLPIFVLGGTNVLVRDKGIRGVVVSLAKLRAIKEEPGSVLYAEGGVGMPTLIGHAIRRSLAGLEWAAGIPGTVAGCVVMNAGTRLGEMKDSVKAVRIVSPKGALDRLSGRIDRVSISPGDIAAGCCGRSMAAAEAGSAVGHRTGREGLSPLPP